MDRRRVVKTMAFALISLNFTSSVKFKQNKTNIYYDYLDPATITIGVSIAKLFIGLFSSGPSIADLVSNIHTQLGIINEKIDLMIDNLKLILTKIENLPSQTVQEGLTIAIKAGLDEYGSIIKTLTSPQLYNGNKENYLAKRENLTKVKNLAREIHTLKQRLRQYSSAELVPYIALAIHIEYFLKANLLEQDLDDFIVDIEQDQNWLLQNVFKNVQSVDNNLTKTKTERNDLLKDLTFKFSSITELKFQTTFWYCFIHTTNCSLDPKNPKENEDIVILKRLGIIGKDVQQYDYKFSNTVSTIDLIRNAYSHGNPPYDLYCNGSQDLQTKTDNFVKERIKGKNETINLNYSNLIKNASEYYAGVQAMEYCQNFLKL